MVFWKNVKAARHGLLPLIAALWIAGTGEAQQAETARGSAPVDLTGYWVSVVSEDWRWRMLTPARGDFASIPLNAEGIRVGNLWDPERDRAAGEECRAYGAPGVMRIPGRVRISWDGEDTLRIETEAGEQTRLFRFGRSSDGGDAPSWQGRSQAQWVYAGGRAAGERGNLKVVTTGIRPGYLRSNGPPYSGDAVVTEYYHRVEAPNGDSWLILTTVVDDPTYLNLPFVTSTHFKKLADGSEWRPEPCVAG